MNHPEPTSTKGALSSATGGLLALAVGVGIGRFVYTPILPPMLASLHMTVFAGGLIASANYLGYLVGALAVSGSRLPGSHCAWLASALLVSAATTALMGIGSTTGTFLILRLLGGISSAFVFVLSSSIVLEHLEREALPSSTRQSNRPRNPLHCSTLSALLFAGVGIGIALSAILVSSLVSAGAGWRLLWAASGGLAFVGAVGAMALIPHVSSNFTPASANVAVTSRGGVTGGVGRIFTPKIRLIISYGLFGFGYVITATFIVTMVRRQPNLRMLEPIIWVIFGVAAAPSTAIWMAVANRLGIPLTYAIACLVEAAGVAATTTSVGVAGVVIASILVSGTFVGITALGLVQARLLAAGDSRRALALMTSAFGFGQIIGPSLAGALAERLGSFSASSGLAAGALLVAAMFAII